MVKIVIKTVSLLYVHICYIYNAICMLYIYDQCICIYAYVYLYVYIYIHTCTYIHTYIHVHTYIHTLCYYCHNSTAPSYVADMPHRTPLHTRITRSSSYAMPLLNRPAHSKATLGDRKSSFASSFVSNSIPNEVRYASSLSSFMSRLKTYLFRSVYKD